MDADVLIVGAGPAGCTAAVVLARAGARVRLVDRARFPRPKLCGDTINPGTLAMLRRLGMADAIDTAGLRVDGMRLTGEHRVVVEARYPQGLFGRAIVRRDLDAALVDEAIAAGALFEDGVPVSEAIVDRSGAKPAVGGVLVRCRGGRTRTIRAPVTIAADGRRSTLAFGLGLAKHPARPRRWAIGGYYQGVRSMSTLGEMHVRAGRYIGVAPLPGGLANVCIVRPSRPGDGDFRDPGALVAREVARDPLLGERFRRATSVEPPTVLGPLAVDGRQSSVEGLLVAGDAAGFIDPITGDGLRFAIRGGELAGDAALEALTEGWDGVHARLARRRRDEFGSKWRFNRVLRRIVSSPLAISGAALLARAAPGIFRSIIARAGDCDLAAGE